MALRTGDRVTLSLKPTIRLTRYDSVQPFASLTRELGDDPEGDLADAEVELLRLLHQDIRRTCRVLGDASDAMGAGRGVEGLVEWSIKEMGDVSAQTTREVEQAEESEARSKGVKPRRKAKPRRRRKRE